MWSIGLEKVLMYGKLLEFIIKMKNGQLWGNSVRMAGIFGVEKKVILDCLDVRKWFGMAFPVQGSSGSAVQWEEAASRIPRPSGAVTSCKGGRVSAWLQEGNKVVPVRGTSGESSGENRGDCGRIVQGR